MAGYWPSSFFCVFMDRDEVEVHKLAKKRTRPISSHLDRTNLVNKGFIFLFFLFFYFILFFLNLFIYFTKTTLFTPITLQYSIYSTLLNIIYSTLLKSLKYLHCFYLLIYLFIYLLCFHAQQTNRQKTKQIPKLTCTINWGYNSYFTLLFTPLTRCTKLGREFTYIYDRL